MKNVLLGIVMVLLTAVAEAGPKLVVMPIRIVRPDQADAATAPAIAKAENEVTERLVRALADSNKFQVSQGSDAASAAPDSGLVLSGRIVQLTFAVQRYIDMTRGRANDVATATLALQYQLTDAGRRTVVSSDVIPLATAPLAAVLNDGITVTLRNRLLNALCLGAAAQLLRAADPVRVAAVRDYTVILDHGSEAGLTVGQHLDLLSAVPEADAGCAATQYRKLAEVAVTGLGPTTATGKLVMPPDVKAEYLAAVPSLIQPGMLCRFTSVLDSSGAIVVPVP
ncbi:MAG: hypothetical protein PHQ27_05455 [Victivallales bacterium]|nr:hypothetical protein [Victivallales bacterium]